MAPLLARPDAADKQFERIYRKYLGDVYRYTLAVLRNPQDAEDVTQTVFLNAYRAMQAGERPDMPKNWLIAIAHNACRQRFRQQQRRPQEMPLYEEAAEAAVEEHDDEYTAEDIQRALGFLAFNQRSALVMRELEGRSYAEIASIMGLSVSAVETLIFRSRRALREQLEGSLTCAQAELLLSKQTDGQLSRAERGQLRAHLRECSECASAARRQRASRGALKAMMTAIPVPTSLASLFGGAGSTAGVALATKAAAVVAAGAVVGGAGYEGAKETHLLPSHANPVAAIASGKQRATGTAGSANGASSRTAHAAEQGKAHGHANGVTGSAPPGLANRPTSPGIVVPPGAKHVKVESHLKITKGFTVPRGKSQLHVTTHVKIVPPGAAKKKSHTTTTSSTTTTHGPPTTTHGNAGVGRPPSTSQGAGPANGHGPPTDTTPTDTTTVP